MDTRRMLAVLLLGLGVTVTTATRIDGVCNVPPASNKTRPEVADLFRVDVECSMLEQNRTIFVREVYDYHGNRGRITQVDAKERGDAFYDYNNNEIYVVDPIARNCLSAPLTQTDDGWTFGYKPDRKDPGHYHIFGASGALHFGDTNEFYNGTHRVRGILADRWDSCQYSEALNATMKVSWYFSVKTDWDMQLGHRPAPLRAEVIGKRYKDGTIQDFHHIYDLYNYEMNVETTDFEIPVGVVCPHRVNSQQFPGFPNRFSFTAETLDYEKGQTMYMEEYYDGVSDINVFRYKRTKDQSQQKYMDRILQVNDYNTGVTYVVDTVSGSCQLKKLGSADTTSFLNVLPNGKMVMKDPAQFFADFSSSLFTYAGVRTTRGISCDLWVGRTNKVKGYTDRYLTVEWYFAVSSDTEKWNSLSNNWRIPVQFRMWDKGEDDPILELNVFYYDTVRPSLINADISSCFHGTHRRRFTFDIDGAQRDAVYNNLEEFKYVLASTIRDHTGISQLRVADIQIYDAKSVMHVSFDLLDKPSISGASTANLTSVQSLDAAVSLYTSAINDHTFQLTLARGVHTQTIQPVFGSSAEVNAQTGSFTTGSLAGLGVGMLLVGSAGGAGGAFFFFK